MYVCIYKYIDICIERERSMLCVHIIIISMRYRYMYVFVIRKEPARLPHLELLLVQEAVAVRVELGEVGALLYIYIYIYIYIYVYI